MELNSINIHKLKKIPLEGGNVLHALKKSDKGFKKFGEVYFSWINPKSIKAWKKHNLMTLNLIVPIGKIRFVFHNTMYPKVFRVEIVGEGNYCRLTVPPNIWFGFQNLSDHPSLVTNISDIEHQDSESDKAEINTFSFKWSEY